MKKRVALVGCGGIAGVHAGVLTGLPETELCCFADCKRERAEEFSAAYCGGRAGAYSSMEEMLDAESPDVLHICTPHYLHVPMAAEALGRNISVFMEKPPAISEEQFVQLERAAAKNRARLGICFQNRYNESTGKIDELLREGALGGIRGARAFVTWNREAQYYSGSGWRGAWATEGGGVLINQSVHTLDLLLRWMGEPEVVEASMANHHLSEVMEVEDTVEAFLGFPGGQRACFYATTAYCADVPPLIELECERGRIRLEGEEVTVKPREGEQTVFRGKKAKVPGKAYWGSGHAACISDFYRCLVGGTAYQNDLASTENTFRVMSRIYRAADCRGDTCAASGGMAGRDEGL